MAKDIGDISSEELERKLKGFLASERETQAQFLLHLAEFDRRRHYETYGYATLWQYCVKVLRMSENQAHYRIEAARLIQKFPLAAEFISRGRVCMTNLVKLRDVLTAENCAELLEKAVGKSKDDVLLLVATLSPKHVPEATLIRRVPDRPVTTAVPERATELQVGTSQPPIMAVPVIAHEPDDFEVIPVSGSKYRIRMLVDRAFIEMLKKSQSVLSHSTHKEREVIERGLRMILDAAAKRHDPNAVKKRRSSRPVDEDSRYVPAELERLVWERDKECCVWQTATGPCGSTHQLEVDHIIAVALEGKTTLENLRLVCAAHNQMHARQDFGAEFIQAKIDLARGERTH